VSSDSSGASVGFSTQSLTNRAPTCTANNVVIGELTRIEGTYTPSGAHPQFVKQFNGFWIGYIGPQAPCSDDSAVQQAATSLVSVFKGLVTTPSNLESLN
jgi:hypothetical protein